MSPKYLLSSSLLLLLAACSGGSDSPKQEPTQKAEGELTEEACELDSECDDGAFCNGTETCDEGFCRLGVAPTCDDGIECTTDSCSHRSNACLFEAPDEDGDGFRDSQCEGPDGEPLGEDCDDSDGDRFPGNPERCTPSDLDHDEDCDPITVGHLDEDFDGYVSSACCNGEGDDQICGEDCDDGDYRRYPEHPEICDEIDNDCDGEVDVNTREVLWYPDEDGDHFGIATDDAVLSCAPIEGHSLRDSDCDDATGAVHSAAVEVCDGADNDCDGETDEDGVCACAPEGNVRACACGPSATGVQSCAGGLWNQCDCTECVSGTADCLGELLPRECIEGRWVVQASCRGIRPICLAGACVCADGTDDCQELQDVVPPLVLSTSPSPDAVVDAANTSSIAVLFTEPVRLPTDPSTHIYVLNELGEPIPGEVQSGGNAVAFIPDSALKSGRSYTLHVLPGLSDLAGNPLSEGSTTAFRTDPQVTSTPLTNEPGVEHDAPYLDVSKGGEAQLVATRRTGGEFGAGTPVGPETFSYNGSDWGAGTVMNEPTHLGVAVDDRGYPLLGLLETPNLRIRQNLGTDWTPTPHTFTGYDTLTGLHVTAEGHALAAVYGVNLSITYRDTGGVFFETNQTLSGITQARSALGNGPAAAIAYVADGDFGVTRTTTSIQAWSAPTTALLGTDGEIHEVTAAVSDSGLATFAVVQTLDGTFGDRKQILVNDYDSALQWTGSWGFPSGEQDRDAQTLAIDLDSTGNVTLIYISDSQLNAVRRLGSAWQPEEAVSLPILGDTVESPVLDVAEDGIITVVWIQGQGRGTNLWGARFTEGQGWTPQLLAHSGGLGISDVAMAVDGAGLAHVVYGVNGLHTLTW